MRSGAIDVIVVYKVDRLTRSLADFAKLVELFDKQAQAPSPRCKRCGNRKTADALTSVGCGRGSIK